MMGNFSNQKYTFQNTPEGLVIAGIEPLVGYIFDTAVLIVQHANKQPPHIAIGYKRLYFSLSVKGPEVEIDLETRIQN